MSLQAGIIGLPNVGKSTLFNALSSAEAESNNYPFTTIDPNVAVVSVPDPRLEEIESRIQPEESIPAAFEILDIAGLVEGASSGEGLGNQFLSNIREVDALVHVVRCFDDDNIAHVKDNIDPVRDLQIVERELMLKDLETIEGRLEKARKNAKRNHREAEKRVRLLEKVNTALHEETPARNLNLTEKEQQLLHDSHLLTDKPVLYVANVDEDTFLQQQTNEYVEILQQHLRDNNQKLITLCAQIEEEFGEFHGDDLKNMLEEFSIEEPALNRLVRYTYDVLGLQTFFTIANQKLRAWPLPAGSTAREAAGVVHSDFEEHFIRAEVFSYGDLVQYGSEREIQNAGKKRVEGKDYVVQDGDILKIRHDA